MLGKLGVGEVAVGEVAFGEVALGKLPNTELYLNNCRGF